MTHMNFHASNVGIGTTAPQSTLQIRSGTDKNILIAAGASDPAAVMFSAVNDLNNAHVPLEIRSSKTNFGIGNVGIGMTSPFEKLFIQGGNIGISTANSNGSTGWTHGGLIWHGYNRGASNNSAAIFAGSTTWDDQGYLSFQTSGDASNAIERMRITETGNVGIGTTNPDHLLQLTKTHAAATTADMFKANYDANWGLRLVQDYVGAGDIRYEMKQTYNSTSYDVLAFKGGNVGIGTTSPGGKLHVAGGPIVAEWSLAGKTSSGTVTNIITPNGDNTVTIGDGGGGWTALRFFTGATESMRVAASGNVGRGMTSPGTVLDVKGPLRAQDYGTFPSTSVIKEMT